MQVFLQVHQKTGKHLLLVPSVADHCNPICTRGGGVRETTLHRPMAMRNLPTQTLQLRPKVLATQSITRQGVGNSCLDLNPEPHCHRLGFSRSPFRKYTTTLCMSHMGVHVGLVLRGTGGCAWGMFGVRAGCAWATGGVWATFGVHRGRASGACGVYVRCMECKQGACWGYVWGIHAHPPARGVCMGYPWGICDM